MALLAETKRKVKFGLDPRNTNWSNDTSKLGQRLMEKMGWEKGQGLGSKGDGMTEHIKASYKSDTRGLGCTPQSADAWIAHQDDFNDLLKTLNSQNEVSTEEELPEKTKPTDGHKRYYGRFARGQVQTLRSTDDLDCIFGRRKSSGTEKSSKKLKVETVPGETEHGVITVTSTSSVQEYFAKKMAELKARKAVASSNETPSSDLVKGEQENGYIDDTVVSRLASETESREDESSDNIQTSRGWYQDFDNDKAEECAEAKKPSKSKKKKKSKEVNDNDCGENISRQRKKKCKDEQPEVSASCRDSEYSEETYVPKKKKHKEEQPATSEVSSSIGGDSQYNEETLVSKKNKRKEKKKSPSDCQNYTETTNCSSNEIKKKKRKKDNDEEIVAESSLCIDNELKEHGGNSKRKKLNGIDDISANTRMEVDPNSEIKRKTRDNKKDKFDPRENDTSKPKKNKKELQSEENSLIPTICSKEDKTEAKSRKKKLKKSDVDDKNETKAANSETEDKNSEDKVASTDVTNRQMMSKHEKKAKKKEKRKIKKAKAVELAGKKSAESNKLFPGSNIADIDGYKGLKISATNSQ